MAAKGRWSIRQARWGDLAGVARMEAAVWKHMAADESTLMKRFRSFPSGFLVADDSHVMAGFCMALRIPRAAASGDRVGMISLEDHRADGPVLFLLGLTIDPLFRKNGIGTALVQAETEVGIKIGCDTIELVANAFSQRLFENLDFKTIQQLSNTPIYRGLQELMPSPTHLTRSL